MKRIMILGLVAITFMFSFTILIVHAEPTLSPLQQVRDGVPPNEIVCSGDRILVISPSGSPACVFVASVNSLEKRGFVKYENYAGELGIIPAVDKMTKKDDMKDATKKDVVVLSNENMTSNNNNKTNLQEITDIQQLTDILNDVPYRSGFYAQSTFTESVPSQQSVESTAFDTMSAGSGTLLSGNSESPSTVYSTTNIQVQGVDEPDYVKTDGKYIYVVNDSKISIILGYPSSDLRILSTIDMQYDSVYNMFLNEDRLIVFYHGEQKHIEPLEDNYDTRTNDYKTATNVMVVDITDRENPITVNTVSIDGNLSDARMIDDNIYFVTAMPIDYSYPRFPTITNNVDSVIITPSVFYFEDYDAYQAFTTLTSINIDDGDIVDTNTYLMGHAGTIYVSDDNFYLTFIDIGNEGDHMEDAIIALLPILPSKLQEQINNIDTNDPNRLEMMSAILSEEFEAMTSMERQALNAKAEKQMETYESIRAFTNIYRFSLDNGMITYKTEGSIAGTLL